MPDITLVELFTVALAAVPAFTLLRHIARFRARRRAAGEMERAEWRLWINQPEEPPTRA
jgi:hypothetical protein